MDTRLFDNVYMQNLVNKFRTAFSKGRMDLALKYWNNLYDALPSTSTVESFTQFNKYISQIPGNEVYAITDYAKHVTGYYS